MDPSGNLAAETAGLVPFIDTKCFQFIYGDTAAGERIIDAQYWSSTRYVGRSHDGKTFGVNFADGHIKGYPGNWARQFARCVRGNPDYGKNDFRDNGDGTITDRATGRMWSKADSGKGLNWEGALAWAQAKNAEAFLGRRVGTGDEGQALQDPDPTAAEGLGSDPAAAAGRPWRAGRPALWPRRPGPARQRPGAAFPGGVTPEQGAAHAHGTTAPGEVPARL